MRRAFVYTTGGVLLHCLLAETQEQRTTGLSREKYVPLQGMLFDLHTPQIASMTMHETHIPLAMLFIDEHGIVCDVVMRAQPGSQLPYSSTHLVRWVLETSPEIAERLSQCLDGRLLGQQLTIYLPHGRLAA